MDERTRELIAIGTSVGAHCQPCLVYHVKKAREMDIAAADIQDAVGVGHMVEKGSMAAMKTFSEEVLNNTDPENSECCSEETTTGGCCC